MTANGWNAAVATIDFAFQPIVNIHTGACFGYEALLRNHAAAGFKSIQHVYDSASDEGRLHEIDLLLRERSIERFMQIPNWESTHLFLNLDNRVLGTSDSILNANNDLLARLNLPPSSVTFEISERHQIGTMQDARHVLCSYKSQGYKLALDDFGTGFSGLQLLYSVEPDFIKIDRFFISDIASDSKKKLFVANIVNISHLLGILVIAEGVETEREYYSCKEIGCDLAQGYLIQRPTTTLSQLASKYPIVESLSQQDRRRSSSEQRILNEQIEVVPPISINMEMTSVFDSFRQHKRNTFFPVVDNMQRPLGIVREVHLKEYVYSQYGKDLLRNRSRRNILPELISKCPVADINTEPERIIEIFSQDENAEGIIMVQDMKYLGFLSAKALIKVIHEIRLTAARDQNPLSKLPGNYMIYEYVSQSLEDMESDFALVYFDFDNFKPFNDYYGFRNGDRAILLFSEILKKTMLKENRFIGHIGGDDFFVGFKNADPDSVRAEVNAVMQRFVRDVVGFYDPKDRKNGFIEGHDREGQARRYAMLTVSAAILHVGRGRKRVIPDEVSPIIAAIKRVAKASPERLSCGSMLVTKSMPVPELAQLF